MEYLSVGEHHIDGVLHLTAQEGWPSLSADPERAWGVMTAPGVIAVVAVDGGEIVGFARALTDGAITTYLAELVVAPSCRGRGIGRRLIDEVFSRCGTTRMDLLVDGAAEAFYRAFQHRQLPGYRIYPDIGRR